MSNAARRGIEKTARAKINLALHVTGQRADGYHLLDSLVVFADVGDQLVLTGAEKTSLEISGPFADDLEVDNDNLVVQAFRKLSAALTSPLPATAFALTKNLPVASGIGGGSADAAAALNGLVDLWQVDIERDTLAKIALSLGADVPVCLESATCRMRGIGEEINRIDNFPPLHCVLVNAGIGVSTPEVFRQLGQPVGQSAPSALPEPIGDDWRGWLDQTGNDLQDAAISLTPEIADSLTALKQSTGCQLARMSGSGATCFGLFGSGQDARDAAGQISVGHPDWWVVATTLADNKRQA